MTPPRQITIYLLLWIRNILHKVVDQIVSETEIDWDDMKDRVVTRNTIRLQSFFYDADFYHLFPDPDPEHKLYL